MSEFIDQRGVELALALLGWLLLQYLNRNRRDVDSAHEKIRTLNDKHHSLELHVSNEYVKAIDMGAEIRSALQPMDARLQSGDNRMQRIEGTLDRIADRLDRVIDGDHAGAGGGRG